MPFPKPDPNLVKEIEEMNVDDFPSASLSTEAPSTESPGTEAPGTEAPSTESPSTESPSTEAPSTEAPAEEDDLEHFRKELEDVLSSKKEPDPKKDKESPTTEAPIEEVNFLKKLGIDEDAEIGPEELNKLLNSAYQMAKADGSKAPQVDAQAIVQQQLEIIETNRSFYEKHSDLTKYRNFVSKVSDDLRSKLSKDDKEKLELGEFLDRVADEARKRLRIKINQKKEEAKDKKDKEKPKFPKQKGQKTGNRPKQKLSPLEQEIAQMNLID